MLCDISHKNIATVHLTAIIDDNVMELHICQLCAKNKTDELKQQLNISDFLSSLVPEPRTQKSEALLKCSFCGMDLSDFRKQGRLGCVQCYDRFKVNLIPLLKKIHGSTHHKGKLPRRVQESVIIDRRIKDLHDRLGRAVQLEEYEEAARLRDEIRKLEKKLK